ncbi:MAG: acyltransferase [Ignavibacteria bacterium]|nr:acyltransferase [Ignavibacteria bacterium]MBK7158352.1 acyltransferase [Ignavibacteria bacterium]MBK7446419.1 acyltransferase [Ignavibacteria bacterium]MBK9405104.1 acyltransferase [Ignavibacteria bacterium]
MKIAAAQISSVLGNLEKNIEHHLRYCDEAIKNKTDMIVFPELSLTGYSLKDINFTIAVNIAKTKLLDKLKEKSKKISIICGLAEEDENFAIYNSGILISDGEIKFSHRKIYPPTYGLFEEFRYFSRGNECRAHNTKFGKIGLLVCEDLWHLSLPYTVAMDGAQIITGIASSPTRLSVNTDKFKNYEINSEHHRTYARILSTYFVFSNRVGFEDGINFWGGSEIVDPFGNVLSAAKLFDEDMIYADINFEEVRRARHQARHFLDEDIDLTVKNLLKIRK